MESIGKYKIFKQLGAGGFGAVYLCHDENMDRDVAIKVFSPKDENVIAFATSSDQEGLSVLRNRFKTEARILAKLHHCPYIVSALDFGELADGSPYYVMDYVPRSLSDELGKDVFNVSSQAELEANERPRPLELEKALGLLEQILIGLAEAHQHGLVHRDIKPSNILLSDKGAARIADFGIAKSPDSQESTVSQLGIGSRNYMAPEQRESAKHVDARADIYAVSVLAYRMITGKLPSGRYVDPNVHVPALGTAVNALLVKGLSEAAEGRYKDAADMLSAFHKALKKRQQESAGNSETATFTDISDNSSQSVIPQRLRPLATLIEDTLIEHGNLDSIYAEMRAMAKVLKVDEQTLNALINEVKNSSSTYQTVMPLYEVITEAAANLSNVKDSDLTPLITAAQLIGKDKAWVEARLKAEVAKNQSGAAVPTANQAQKPSTTNQIGDAEKARAQTKTKPKPNTGKQQTPIKEPETNKQANQQENTSSYKPVWVTVCVLLLAVGGYMGWATLNPAGGSPAVVSTTGTSSSGSEASTTSANPELQPAALSTLASLTAGDNILQITSEPSGAIVLFNGVELGATPLERQDLTPGNYQLTLQSPYHEQYTAQVEIEADLVFKENYVLQAANGNLTITSEPSGAEIHINGQASNEVTPASLTDLEAGVYDIELRRDGYQAATLSDVEVLPDSTARASGTLNKLWRLTINTEPANAQIRLPDITPTYAAGMQLPLGDYQVEVSAPYHQPRTETVSLVDADISTTVSLERSHYQLTVQAEPANARVRLLGSNETYNPNGTWLSPGSYEVEVSAQRYIPQTFTLSLTSDQRRSVELEIDAPLPEMVTIPAGRFQMGSNEYRDEEPVHSVTIPRAFALSKTEITFAQYDAYAEDTGAEKPDDRGWGRGNRPVIYVTWNDAQAYIGWLNGKTNGNYRLPTEAEWEYAARAGTTTEYSWGNEIGQNRANCDGCGSEWDDSQTAPVGSFPANAFGLQDMHGNVWEWVQDCWNASYEGAPNNGSAWMQGDCDRAVLRGGCWSSIPGGLRSAGRSRSDRANRGYGNGFRIAQDL